jgi:hypothetical protein
MPPQSLDGLDVVLDADVVDDDEPLSLAELSLEEASLDDEEEEELRSEPFFDPRLSVL